MKQLIYIVTLVFSFYSCNNKTNNQNVSIPVSLTTETNTGKQNEIGDSIYKIGDFFFEAKKNAKFEFIANGQKSKIKTKGDTLYSDNKIIMLGDIHEIVSLGIFKRFTFKSKFIDFKVDNVYKGKLASPNFTTDPSSKRFKFAINDGCKKEGVNYAGHYTIVEWGCGTVCAEMAIVDRITGQIIYSQIPFDKADGHSGSNYKIDSRMLIVNTEALSEFDNYEPGYMRFNSSRKPEVFEIINGRLKQIE
jgi:hypothetical protein